MNDSDSPKPLPDDFGMTLANFRPPRQSNTNDDAALPTTQLRQPANQPPPSAPPADDFGATMPNMRLGASQPPPSSAPRDDFDMTAPNFRINQPPPSEPDFGLTMPNVNRPNQNQSNDEPNFGATMPYFQLPQNQMRETAAFVPPAAAPPQTKQVQKKRGVPVWAWLVSGGLALIALLAVGGLAAFLLLFNNSGFTLVIKGAPAGSTVFIDNTRRGVTSADGSTKILGIKADEKRSIKVTHEGYTDFNDTVLGANGETKEIIAQMKQVEVAKTPDPPKSDCEEADKRVCLAEDAALDALDKLQVPFTVDQLVAALNLHIINFASNSADVPPARKRFLERAAEKFNLLTGKPVVQIGGHTDNVGNAAANLDLSDDRAKAVRGLLVNFGVKPEVLQTQGFGSTKPKTDNATDEGKFQNRRIEYSVISR